MVSLGDGVSGVSLTLTVQINRTLLREVRILQKLGDHPRRLLEEVQVRGKKHIGLKMKYFEHDLFGLSMSKVRFKGLEVKGIFKSVVEQLKTLHDLDLVHRDIKSANILVSRQGEVSLIDFGQTLSQEAARSDFKCGTSIYRSPEMLCGFLNQQKGLPTDKTCTQAADVWGLGCLLAELLLGRPLFLRVRTPSDLIEMFEVLFGDHPSLAELRTYSSKILTSQVRKPEMHPLRSIIKRRSPESPADLLNLLCQLLHPDPNQRPTCKEILLHQSFDFDAEESRTQLARRLDTVELECHEHQVRRRMILKVENSRLLTKTNKGKCLRTLKILNPKAVKVLF